MASIFKLERRDFEPSNLRAWASEPLRKGFTAWEYRQGGLGARGLQGKMGAGLFHHTLNVALVPTWSRQTLQATGEMVDHLGKGEGKKALWSGFVAAVMGSAVASVIADTIELASKGKWIHLSASGATAIGAVQAVGLGLLAANCLANLYVDFGKWIDMEIISPKWNLTLGKLIENVALIAVCLFGIAAILHAEVAIGVVVAWSVAYVAVKAFNYFYQKHHPEIQK